jgi:hypothetical protein
VKALSIVGYLGMIVGLVGLVTTRSIEWQVSELEESLRGNRQDAAARRHMLNNLSYEIEALNRRSR